MNNLNQSLLNEFPVEHEQNQNLEQKFVEQKLRKIDFFNF